MKKHVKLIASALVLSLVFALCSCDAGTKETTTETEEEGTQDYLEGYDTFEVTSEDLIDGVWSDVISKDCGDNVSPQLSWEAVEGAELYIIYMVDPDAGYWIHWKSDAVTETTLPQGWASSTEYVGPYPPNGTTHTYSVFVFALKDEMGKVPFAFDNGGNSIFKIFDALDIDANGNEGNVLAYGRLDGNFTMK